MHQDPKDKRRKYDAQNSLTEYQPATPARWAATLSRSWKPQPALLHGIQAYSANEDQNITTTLACDSRLSTHSSTFIKTSERTLTSCIAKPCKSFRCSMSYFPCITPCKMLSWNPRSMGTKINTKQYMDGILNIENMHVQTKVTVLCRGAMKKAITW